MVDSFGSEGAQFLADLNSTAVQTEIAQKATRVARQIPEVEAVILRGSLATQSGDIFSDIDLLLLCQKPDQLEGIKKTFLSQAHQLGPVIHSYSSVVNPINHLLIFDPMVQLELDLKSYQQAASSWKTAKGVLLYDRTGLGRSAIENAQRIVFDIDAHKPFLTNTAAIVPVSVYLIYGYYTRGERLAALDDLDWLRNQMLRASSYLLGMQDEGPRRAETKFPADVVHYYRETRTSTARNIWAAVELILKWYADWMIPRFQELDVAVPNNLLTRVRTCVDELHRRSRTNGT